jgi:hypothetical protein
LTCDPAVDVNDYYDIPSWNADGSVLGFLTRRRGGGLRSAQDQTGDEKGGLGAALVGGRERWLMDANGDHLRPMPTPDGRPIRSGYWSQHDRDRFYHARTDENGTHIVALDPFTGLEQTIVSVKRDLGVMMPPHPSEEWFLFGKKVPGNEHVDTPSYAYVVGLDASVQEVRFERRWHRLRFTKAPDRRLFFNYDQPRTQWTILPDGTDRHAIPYSGGHPDWLPDGSELTFYAEGSVWGIRYDGTGRREVMRLESGGHGGPCLDGEWFVSDTPPRGKYPGSILCFRVDGSGTCHTLFKHASSMYRHSARGWHPDHHATHPHPNSSPDGTKVIFNSDLIGEYTDLFVAVNRFPDPPRNVRARVQGDQVVLDWDKPARSREVHGYLVYWADEDGMTYHPLTDAPVAECEYLRAAGDLRGRYVVTALEWSGLEGRPSNIASTDSEPPQKEAVRLAPSTTAPRAPQDVQVAPLSPNTLHVTWSGVPGVIDHYNVYCGRTADFACEQASLVGSPSSAEFVDWGLTLNTDYWYRVTAVNWAGAESPPSDAVRASTPPFVPVHIELQPPGATLVGMELWRGAPGTEDTALWPDADGEWSATWTFEVSHDGAYAIWGRSMQERPQNEDVGRDPTRLLIPHFDLILDGDLAIPWEAWGLWGQWHWSPAGTMVTGSPQVFELSAGEHVLQVRPRTPRSPVAGIVITDDPSWWPVQGMAQRTQTDR